MLINRYGGEVSSLGTADPTFVSVTASGYMVGNKYYSRDRCIHIRNVYVDRQTGLGISTLKHAYDTLTLSKTADSETEGIISGR